MARTKSMMKEEKRVGLNMGERAFQGLGDLIKLLPSGTVFVFQFMSPLVTDNGRCAGPASRGLSGLLLACCGLSCCLSSFTDSYVVGGRVFYGIATRAGLWAFSDPDAARRDLSGYKLRAADFVHAALSLTVFAAVALLDPNTVRCFYPTAETAEGTLIKILPAVIGAVASTIFAVFPNERHGIGYPPERVPPPPPHEEEY